jgi:ABC-type spermidine/putrescine transport system permease subunit I
MIGRWGKAAAVVALGSAVVVDLGLAAAVLDHARDDLPAAWAALSAVSGPRPRLALAGRDALLGGAAAGVAAAAAALLLGAAAAVLTPGARAVLLALTRIPALCCLLIGVLSGALVLARSGPVAAALVGFAAATRPLGARWSLAIVLLPLAIGMVETAARRLDPEGSRSLATLGFGPLRRLFAINLPAVLPTVMTAAVVVFLLAAASLFVVAWPVPARQSEVSQLGATVALRPLAALSFCAAGVLAAITAFLGGPPD